MNGPVPNWLAIAAFVVPILAGLVIIVRPDRFQETDDEARLARLGGGSRYDRRWYESHGRGWGYICIAVGLLQLLLWWLRS